MNIKTITLVAMLAISGSVNAALVQPESYTFDKATDCDNRCYYDQDFTKLTDGIYGSGTAQSHAGNGWVGWDLFGPVDSHVNIDFTFSGLQQINQITLGSIADKSYNHTIFSVFTMDSQGDWIAADISSSTWTDYTLTILGDFTATSKIRLQGSSPDRWVLVDEVQFEGSAVPVPAAAWLFGSALLGLVGLKRKQ